MLRSLCGLLERQYQGCLFCSFSKQACSLLLLSLLKLIDFLFHCLELESHCSFLSIAAFGTCSLCQWRTTWQVRPLNDGTYPHLFHRAARTIAWLWDCASEFDKGARVLLRVSPQDNTRRFWCVSCYYLCLLDNRVLANVPRQVEATLANFLVSTIQNELISVRLPGAICTLFEARLNREASLFTRKFNRLAHTSTLWISLNCLRTTLPLNIELLILFEGGVCLENAHFDWHSDLLRCIDHRCFSSITFIAIKLILD